MARNKNAVLYLRRSTEKQEQSIDDQRKVLEAYAKAEGYSILEEYTDDAVSGADTARRRDFHRMIADARSGAFHSVLVYDVSRFSRDDPDEAGHWRYMLRQHGAEVIYVADNIPDGDEGDLVLSVQQWTKHQFLVNLSRDTLRGAISTARKGYSCGRPAPYGYRRLAIDEVAGSTRVLEKGQHSSQSERVRLTPAANGELDVVRRIFDLYVNRGYGYRRIAQLLNREGIQSPRGKKWCQSTIRDLLLNPAYGGDAVYNRHTYGKFHGTDGEGPVRRPRTERGRTIHNEEDSWIVVTDAHDAIVPRSLSLAARAKIKDKGRRQQNRQRASSPYLLSGLVFCSCGSKMHGMPLVRRHNGNEYRYRRYACGEYLSGARVGHPSTVDAEALERVVVAKIRSAYFQADIRAQVVETMRQELQAVSAQSGSEKAALSSQLKEADTVLARARRRVLMVEDDAVAIQLMTEVRELSEQRTRLAARLDALDIEPTVGADDPDALADAFMGFLEHLDQGLSAVDPEARKECIRLCVATPNGAHGPVSLCFKHRQTKGGRFRGKLVSGRLGLVNPTAQAFYRKNGGGNGIRTRDNGFAIRRLGPLGYAARGGRGAGRGSLVRLVVDAAVGGAVGRLDLAVELVLGVADPLLELDDAFAERAHDAGQARAKEDERDDANQDGLRRPEIQERYGQEAMHR